MCRYEPVVPALAGCAGQGQPWPMPAAWFLSLSEPLKDRKKRCTHYLANFVYFQNLYKYFIPDLSLWGLQTEYSIGYLAHPYFFQRKKSNIIFCYRAWKNLQNKPITSCLGFVFFGRRPFKERSRYFRKFLWKTDEIQKSPIFRKHIRAHFKATRAHFKPIDLAELISDQAALGTAQDGLGSSGTGPKTAWAISGGSESSPVRY